MTAPDRPPSGPRRPIAKVLLANRGEIVIRVARTLREMDIRSVAVYSAADARAPHVIQADEAYPIGPAEPGDSYLNQERLIETARAAGCDAVHPGYGFLSENAGFASRCVAAGLTFIGPPPAAILAMGSKVESRRLMTAAGVPVVPGSDATDQQAGDLERLKAAAEGIGYPVLVKASAGGGGKGMRVVRHAADFPAAARAARGEAEKAFGDGRLYVEKYLARPRHVEFQVFADDHGHCVHLFERECSIQRRHQKIIEESPSPALDDRLRRAMGAAAVAAARAVDYRGAGTVEFLVDEDRRFYFLEMNTRLQVEHPVTEEITGLDLVRLQVDVAAGRPLPAAALAPVSLGHALECRIYAEDPARGFLPVSGDVLRVRHPRGPGLRIDSALRDGFQVPIHYDPMLAKVISHGRDRDEAIRRMRLALAEFVILGLETNLLHLQAVLDSPRFQRGDLSTHFLEEELPDWGPRQVALPRAGRVGLLLHDFARAAGGAATSAGDAARSGAPADSPWATLTGFRVPFGEEA